MTNHPRFYKTNRFLIVITSFQFLIIVMMMSLAELFYRATPLHDEVAYVVTSGAETQVQILSSIIIGLLYSQFILSLVEIFLFRNRIVSIVILNVIIDSITALLFIGCYSSVKGVWF